MSLNEEQREGTRRELAKNLELSGRTSAAIALELDWDPTRVAHTLAIDESSDPADVWMLRDALERAVRERGGVPERYSVPTDAPHRSAQRWFGLPKRR